MQSAGLQCVTRRILKISDLKFIYMFLLDAVTDFKDSKYIYRGTTQIHTCIELGAQRSCFEKSR